MRLCIWILGLACLAPTPSFAQRFNVATAESELLTLERLGKVQAVEDRDWKTLNAIFDETFVWVRPDGRVMTKPELLAEVRSAHRPKFVPEAMVVKLHGDTAIVTGLYQIKGPDNGTGRLQRGRFVDTWFHKSGGWVAIASLTTPSTR